MVKLRNSQRDKEETYKCQCFSYTFVLNCVKNTMVNIQVQNLTDYCYERYLYFPILAMCEVQREMPEKLDPESENLKKN